MAAPDHHFACQRPDFGESLCHASLADHDQPVRFTCLQQAPFGNGFIVAWNADNQVIAPFGRSLADGTHHFEIEWVGNGLAGFRPQRDHHANRFRRLPAQVPGRSVDRIAGLGSDIEYLSLGLFLDKGAVIEGPRHRRHVHIGQFGEFRHGHFPLRSGCALCHVACIPLIREGVWPLGPLIQDQQALRDHSDQHTGLNVHYKSSCSAKEIGSLGSRDFGHA